MATENGSADGNSEEKEELKQIEISAIVTNEPPLSPLKNMNSPGLQNTHSVITPTKGITSKLSVRSPFDITFADFKHKSYGKLFVRLVNELMNTTERRSLYVLFFFTLCCGTLRLIFFIFIGGIIDLLADTYHANLHKICNIHKFITCSTSESLIHVFVITLILISIGASLIRFTQSTLTSFCAHSLLKRLNCRIFDKIVNQNLSFFNQRSKSDLRCLLTDDMKHLNKSLHNIIIITEASVHFLCGLMYLLVVNWDIALIIIASFVILSIISVVYVGKNQSIHQIRKKAFNIVVMGVTEMLSYITTIKTFSKENDESFIYSVCIARGFDKESAKKSLFYAYKFWMRIWIYLTILAIIWYGSYIIKGGKDQSHITLGDIVIDLFILLQLNFSIYQIVILLPSVVVKCGESISRILAIWEIENKNIEKNGHAEKEKFNFIPANYKIDGKIEMKNISFSYSKRAKSKLILDNISLTFLPSSTTALVGVSGSGKSTICKLLMRFFESQNGEILVDDIDIKNYNLPFLHSQIGYVGQIIHLFQNRTIGDNIKFGMKLDQKHHYLFDAEFFDEESMYFWRIFKSITQQDVEAAAQVANAHDFIINLENGYDTMIGGENGIQLSHGEKQRIGIARAILLNPKILLLDEAMSGVDAISRHLIRESLDKIMIGRCVIVIAHRLKTVQNANRIYVIKNGKIVGDGTHLQLMESRNQHYDQLTKIQTFRTSKIHTEMLPLDISSFSLKSIQSK